MEDQIKQLQSQLKQLRGALSIIALLFLFFILLVLFRNTDPTGDLHLSSLEIVNEDENVVIHLGVRGDGSGELWITDEDGKRELSLDSDESGGVITILASDGSETQIMGIKENGEAQHGNQ